MIPLGEVGALVHAGAWTDIGTVAEYEAARGD
jgi:NDP-sugar pyrophosphorylase family protein